MRLSKWQGLGNDYLIMEESEVGGRLTPEAIETLCDRHLGVGSDGILLNCTPTGAILGAAARMRVFNPDGSEPEMCGNGIRMFARYLSSRGLVEGKEFLVETLAGGMRPRLVGQYGVRVDMGLARHNSENLASESVSSGANGGLEGDEGKNREAVLKVGRQRLRFTFVDVGNPHCVIRVGDPDAVDLAKVGPLIENHAFFPNRTNVEFFCVGEDGSATMRVWERGVGETRACGTGATAVGAACVKLGLASSPVLVHLPGGDLTIEVEPVTEGPDVGASKVHMSGPAEESFSAELAGDLLQRLGWL